MDNGDKSLKTKVETNNSPRVLQMALKYIRYKTKNLLLSIFKIKFEPN